MCGHHGGDNSLTPCSHSVFLPHLCEERWSHVHHTNWYINCIVFFSSTQQENMEQNNLQTTTSRSGWWRQRAIDSEKINRKNWEKWPINSTRCGCAINRVLAIRLKRCHEVQQCQNSEVSAGNTAHLRAGEICLFSHEPETSPCCARCGHAHHGHHCWRDWRG